MGFARGRTNHPMGYLLIGRGERPLSFVPFYVRRIRRYHLLQLADLNPKAPKTISGAITVSQNLFSTRVQVMIFGMFSSKFWILR